MPLLRSPGLRDFVIAAVAMTVALFTSHAAISQPAADPAVEPVTVGFLRQACGSWAARVADGGYDNATGRTIRWLAFDTDSVIAAALAAGRIHVGLVGSGVAAAAYAQGLDLRVFFVMGRASEGDSLLLSEKASMAAGNPKALRSKVIAVPFGSSSHFRLLDSLRRWQLTLQDVRVVNLQMPQILDAWQRREIDAAVVPYPALASLRPSATIGSLAGERPADGLVVLAAEAAFAARHAVFLSRLVDMISRSSAAPAGSNSGVEVTSETVEKVAALSGLSRSDAATAIARYQPPTLDEQMSATWLGGDRYSGLAAALKSAAETLHWAGRIKSPDIDFAKAIAIEPVQRAIGYQR